MKGEIIAIGDELMAGRIANTTSLFAAKRLFEAGYSIQKMSVIGDKPEAISDALGDAMKKCDFVIVTGGLGPTADDLTTEVISKALGRKLVFNNQIKQQIENHFYATGQELREEYFKLAWLPEGAMILDKAGIAAGYLLEHDGKALFFLPGIPGQMQDLFDRKVLPYLGALYKPAALVRQEIIKIFGLSESEIDARCSNLEKDFRVLKIGYYPEFPEVHISLTISCEGACEVNSSAAKIREEVLSRLYPHVFGSGADTMEKVVGDLLRARKLTLSLAESCTGGLIAHRITRVAGSSDYFERGLVTYSNISKTNILGVKKDTLDRYGAVSAETAREMAEGVRKMSRTDIAISVTGIAGPTGGTSEKPVGTVFIGMATNEEIQVDRFLFWGTREMIQEIATETALDGLRRYLL